MPAKPQFYWALTDIPNAMQAKQLHGNCDSNQTSADYARDFPKSPSKNAAKVARKPLIGRPASAPQLQRSKATLQAQLRKSRTPSPVRRKPQHPQGREVCGEASQEASVMTVPIIAPYDRQKKDEMQAPSTRRRLEEHPGASSSHSKQVAPKVKSQKMAWQETASEKVVQQLGYQPGLPRKPGAQSLIPKHVSDLPNVLAHMERLKAEQLELAQDSRCEGVKIKTQKDVCVLEFPNKGARLLVNRWRPGYSELQQPNRAQSAHGRRARSSPHLSRSTGFPCTQVQPVQSVQTAQKGSQGVSVLNFELVGKAD